jgi:hypothetical protein
VVARTQWLLAWPAMNSRDAGARRSTSALVQPGAGVGRIGHLGHHGAVVFGPGVAALQHTVHRPQAALFPTVVGGTHVGMHGLAPAADLAVHRPHHQGVAAAGFQRVDIGLGAGRRHRVARAKGAGAQVGGRDRRERRHRRTITGLPEAGVGDVQPLVAVQRDGDVVQPVGGGVDEGRHPLQVGVCAGHWQRRRLSRGAARRRQVAEVVLRVDEKEVCRHGSRARCLRAEYPRSPDRLQPMLSTWRDCW